MPDVSLSEVLSVAQSLAQRVRECDCEDERAQTILPIKFDDTAQQLGYKTAMPSDGRTVTSNR